MPAKVFISYSNVDLVVATRAKKVLDAAGHEAHVAEYDTRGGAVITDDIKRRIQQCDIFVVLWSSNAKQSDWVSQEIGIAEDKGKIIVPIVLEAGLKPGGFISGRKFVAAHEDLEKAVAELRVIVDEEVKKKQAETEKAVVVFAAIGLLIAALSSK